MVRGVCVGARSRELLGRVWSAAPAPADQRGVLAACRTVHSARTHVVVAFRTRFPTLISGFIGLMSPAISLTSASFPRLDAYFFPSLARFVSVCHL